MQKLFTSIICLLVISVGFAQKADLSLNLEKGKNYKQIASSRSTITQDFNGQQMKIVMSVKGAMIYSVTNIAEYYEMDVFYESLSLSMEMPQGSMEFSSDKNDENDIFSKILKEMINQPFQINMSKKGKVVEVKNIDQMFNSAFDQFTDIPESQLVQIKDQLKKAYGEAALKGNIEMVTAIYPDQPVAINDSWKINTKLESGMSADMNTTYTYAGSAADHFLIKGESTIETADKNAYIETNGVPMKYNLKGTMTSTIKVDKDSGWIIEANISQNIGGDVSIDGNDQMPEGMTIPMNLKTDLKYTNQ